MTSAAALRILVCLSCIFGTLGAAPPPTSASPRQQACDPTPFRIQEATLFPKAIIEGQFRLLSVKFYDDPIAPICPVDLAVAWGPFLSATEAEKLHVQQDQRHYAWAYWGSKWTEQDVARHSANVHLVVPEGPIRDRLHQLQKGQRVRLKGRLVDVEHPQLASRWKSSLTREDTGTGSCEILWLESLELFDDATP